MSKKMKIPTTLQTRAEFKPETFDSEKRTVDIVWSTGARVKRFQWFGPDYYEELSMSPQHIRLDRFKNGANVLNNHSNYDLRNVIGVIEKASVKDGEGHATIRLSDRDDVKGIVRDIENGIIRNLSVGYKVHKYKKIKEKKEDRSEDDDEETTLVYRAVDWEPMEVSFVCIPADAKSQVRSENNNNDSFEVEVDDELNNEGETMKTRGSKGAKAQEEDKKSSDADSSSDSSGKAAGDAGSSESGSEGSDDGAKEEQPAGGKVPTSQDGDKPEGKRSEVEIRKMENERRKEIIKAVRLANLDDSFAEKLVDDVDMTVDKARAEIFKQLETSQPETRNNKIEVISMDNKQLRREATVRGILHRFNPEKFKLKEGDSEFRQPSLIMTARHYLHNEMNQRDAFMISDSEVATRALHHTSDFPLLLADVSNASLRAGYDSIPSTYELFTRINTGVTNFKDINSYEVSKGGMLRPVNEHGEYERGTLEETGEKYRVQKFGLIIGKTWELMINDELGAFTQIAQNLGVRAREMENKMFWDLILSNPVMSDGKAFFHADHNNLGAAAALGEAPLAAARTRSRLMKDLDGELIGVEQKYLVVPAALELAADKLLAPITPATQDDVNVFSGKLQRVVEPRIDAVSPTGYYTFADKARMATAEMARLNNQGPQIFTREGFDIDGQEVKVRYVFGMKLINYRAAQFNPGA